MLTSREQLQLWEQGLCPGKKVCCNINVKGYQKLRKYQGNPLQQSIEALLMCACMVEYVVKLSVMLYYIRATSVCRTCPHALHKAIA